MQSKLHTLYIVSTPIGNLGDLTFRAVEVLRAVGLIAAEDTRTTRKLLSRYGIKSPLTSYHQHNKLSKLPHLLARLEECDVALVSDAGTPGLSDPGYELINASIARGVPVVPVPGPSVVLTALVVSGLPTDQFTYVGFLPRRKTERRHVLASLQEESRTVVAFESPHRLRASLEDILEILGDRRMAVCRELTKLHEEVFRGTVSEALAHFGEPLGEFTLVIQGAGSPQAGDEAAVRQRLGELKVRGWHAKKAVAEVSAAFHMPKRVVYRLWLEVGS